MQTTDTISYDASPAIELAGRAQQMLDSATDFVIDSPALFDLASDDLRRIKALQKDVEEQRTRITGPLNQAVKAVNDLFRAPRDYLDKAERSLKRSIATWLHEQERQAAEARAQAEAQARAERERLARERRPPGPRSVRPRKRLRLPPGPATCKPPPRRCRTCRQRPRRPRSQP